MNGTLAHVKERLRTGYWLVPGLMVAGYITLAELMLWSDTARPDAMVAALSWLAVPGSEGSRNVLAAIAGSMVTVAAMVFSITMLTLSTASQQFGPRVLRTFMRDRWNQVTLGVFTGTFAYALLVLRTAGRKFGEEFVPHLSVSVAMLLALGAVGVLVAFIHHVSVHIQGPQIIARIARELDDQIDAFFPEDLGRADPHPQAPRPSPAGQCRTAYFDRAGYVDAITNAALRAAEEHRLHIELLAGPGEYVLPGQAAANLYGGAGVNQEVLDGVAGGFILAEQRTPAQDPAFSFGQLTEVACRALSKGINDPFTAATCIDHLSGAFVRLAQRRMPAPVRTGNGEGRVETPGPTFPRLLRDALAPLREYGASHAMVVDRLARALARIRATTRRPEDRAAVEEQYRLLCADAQHAQQERAGWPAVRDQLCAAWEDAPRFRQDFDPGQGRAA